MYLYPSYEASFTAKADLIENIFLYFTDSNNNSLMTTEHRNSLTEKATILADNMEPFFVIQHLISKGILTQYDCQRINCQETQYKQCVLLLEILETKPDMAFSVLIEALKETNQKHLAGLLTLI